MYKATVFEDQMVQRVTTPYCWPRLMVRITSLPPFSKIFIFIPKARINAQGFFLLFYAHTILFYSILSHSLSTQNPAKEGFGQ